MVIIILHHIETGVCGVLFSHVECLDRFVRIVCVVGDGNRIRQTIGLQLLFIRSAQILCGSHSAAISAECINIIGVDVQGAALGNLPLAVVILVDGVVQFRRMQHQLGHIVGRERTQLKCRSLFCRLLFLLGLIVVDAEICAETHTDEQYQHQSDDELSFHDCFASSDSAYELRRLIHTPTPTAIIAIGTTVRTTIRRCANPESCREM